MENLDGVRIRHEEELEGVRESAGDMDSKTACIVERCCPFQVDFIESLGRVTQASPDTSHESQRTRIFGRARSAADHPVRQARRKCNGEEDVRPRAAPETSIGRCEQGGSNVDSVISYTGGACDNKVEAAVAAVLTKSGAESICVHDVS